MSAGSGLVTATEEFRIANRIAEIAPTLDRVEAFLEVRGATPAVSFRFRLALDELLTNVISHALPADQPHEIIVDVSVVGSTAVCELSDPGAPFDPLARPTPDLDADLDARPIGGLGIHLVRQSIPDVSYRRENGRNIMRLAAPLAEPG
jgi:anti-sigma regulatory factor (Ser/Thr protein kinase)